MPSYVAARTIFGILELVAWTAVVTGIIAAVSGASAGSYFSGHSVGLIGAAPGAALALLGLVAAATVQYFRAGVDSAEMTGKMLKIAEEQLKVSKEASKASFGTGAAYSQSQPTSAKPATPAAEPVLSSASTVGAAPKATAVEATPGKRKEPPVFARAPTLETITHDGVSIRRTEDAFFIGELRFTDLELARAFIDEQLSKAKMLVQT